MKRTLPLLLWPLVAGCGLFASPENELTTVQGTVRNEFNQQPMAGALVELRSCHYTLGGWSCIYLDDTVRTDASGHYTFSFRTAKKRAYRVLLSQDDNRIKFYQPEGTSNNDNNHLLAEGKANTVDFQAFYDTVLRVHLVNRNVGRRYMYVGAEITRAGTIDTVVFIRGFMRNRPVTLRGQFYNRNAAGYAVDTLSIRKSLTPGPGDTVNVDFGLIRP